MFAVCVVLSNNNADYLNKDHLRHTHGHTYYEQSIYYYVLELRWLCAVTDVVYRTN